LSVGPACLMLAIMDGYDGRRARPITTTPKTVPIGDYGFLSDGEALALLSPGGAVHWMCLPRLDSPTDIAIFRLDQLQQAIPTWHYRNRSKAIGSACSKRTGD